MEQEKSRRRLLQVAAFVLGKTQEVQQAIASEIRTGEFTIEDEAQLLDAQAKLKTIQFNIKD